MVARNTPTVITVSLTPLFWRTVLILLQLNVNGSTGLPMTGNVVLSLRMNVLTAGSAPCAIFIPTGHTYPTRFAGKYMFKGFPS